MTAVTLNIDFRRLNEIAQRGIRRAAAFVAMGQKAWSDESIRSVKVDTPFQVQLLPDPLPDALAAEVRSAFRLWTIGNALTEMVQGLSLMADEYYVIAALVPHKTVPEDFEKAHQRVKNDTNLHGKLLRVEADTGVRPPLLDHTGGWAKARNVWAHNHGIVRASDVSPASDGLVVTWNEIELSIDGDKLDVEKAIGHRVEKGGQIGFKSVRAEKSFKPGEQIVFSEQEIMNICLSAHTFTDASIQELEKHVARFVEKKDDEAAKA